RKEGRPRPAVTPELERGGEPPLEPGVPVDPERRPPPESQRRPRARVIQAARRTLPAPRPHAAAAKSPGVERRARTTSAAAAAASVASRRRARCSSWRFCRQRTARTWRRMRSRALAGVGSGMGRRARRTIMQQSELGQLHARRLPSGQGLLALASPPSEVTHSQVYWLVLPEEARATGVIQC